MTTTRILTVLATAGLAASAMAQDSVSTTATSDAIGAYDLTRQVTKYTVDLAPIVSGRGFTYGVAPVIKASNVTVLPAGFGNIRVSAQNISRHIENDTLATGTYASWTGSIGAGVGPNNSAGQNVALPGGNLHSLALGFSEFEPNVQRANLVAGLVTFDPSNRARLFVDRIVTATNAPNATSNGSAAFGMGSIDTRLNLTSRADGFGQTGTLPLLNQNIFRFNADLRTNGVLNSVNRTTAGQPAATERVFDGAIGGFTTDTLSNASAIPELDGGPTTFGPTFGAQLAVNDHASGTSAHRTPTFVGLPNLITDHRGTFGYNPVTPLGGVGTVAAMLRDTATVFLGVFGVDANAVPQSVATFQPPLTIQDNVDSYGVGGAPFGEFRHYRSQMAFSGPIGAAAPAVDANGDVLAASVFDIACTNCEDGFGNPIVFAGGAAQAPINGVAVLRFDPADPVNTQEWTLAAWVNGDTGFGKPIRDGSGVETGFLVPLNAFPGLIGPSISGAAFDNAGNLYFTSPFLDYGPDGMFGTADDDVDTGLFRAIYDPATFSFELDVILQTGDVVASQGTGLNYNIGLIRVADSNSTDSAAFFGQNATYDPYPLSAPTGEEDPNNLGALVVNASITYDRNNDGTFDFTFGSGDEAYTVALYVSPLDANPITDCNGNGIDDAQDIASGTSDDVNADGIPDECQLTRRCADVNNDGLVAPNDFSSWIAAFNTQNYRADQNNDGLVLPNDFSAWIGNFNLGINGPLCVE